MNTIEQAKALWCPMARVAQIGAVETNATYNRAITKTHVPVKLSESSKDDFELFKESNQVNAAMLKVEMQTSGAALCVANKCAMWRWDGNQQIARHRAMWADALAAAEPQRPSGLNPAWVFVPYSDEYDEAACWVEPEELWQARRRGYCGIAGRPEVAV